MHRPASMPAAAIAAADVLHVLPTRGPPDDSGCAPAGNGAAFSAELTEYLADDHDRIARGLNDVVVRRIFAAGLDLQAALALIGDHRGAGKIYHAIDELDQAIRDIRGTIFNPRPPGSRFRPDSGPRQVAVLVASGPRQAS
jgi:signal transduction histidine kinase